MRYLTLPAISVLMLYATMALLTPRATSGVVSMLIPASSSVMTDAGDGAL